MTKQFTNPKQKGFSLVELMVALVLGLVVLSTVSTVLVTSKKTYSTSDRMARLQENARFAMQFLIRDLRLAGYYGCMDDITAVNSTLNTGASNVFDNFSIPLEGANNATGTYYPSGDALPTGILANTDAIKIRMLDPNNAVQIDEEMPNPSAELKVTSISGVNDNDILAISDCSSADIFQVTAVQTSSIKIQHNPGGGTNPGNRTGQNGWMSKAYAPPASVMKFSTRQYYVKNNDDGVPTLYRQELTAAEQPLVEGIESLQVLYGKDTDSDGVPNVYLPAGAAGSQPLSSTTDWGSIVSIRVGIMARTLNDKDNVEDVNSSYDVNGQSFSVSAGDKFRRRVFTSTIMLRNL